MGYIEFIQMGLAGLQYNFISTNKTNYIVHTEPWNLLTEVKQLEPTFFDKKKVLEVGSLDINGTVRGFFSGCWYTGLDIGLGKGVDIVCPIHEFFAPEEFDVLVSTEMLEHDIHWEESLKQMYTNLKPGGLFIFSCAGPQRHEHGTKRTTPQDSPYTTDYYRNISIDDFSSILPKDLFSVYQIKYERGEADLIFWGLKNE